MRAKHEAFTLVEMLVVLAVLGILVGLLLPAILAARENARIAGCLSNLKQLGQAIDLYMSDYDRTYPFGLDPVLRADIHDDGGKTWSRDFIDRWLAMPDLRDLLRPYGASPEVWRCPSHKAWSILPGQLPPRDVYVTYGTSYNYDPWLPALGARETLFPDPANSYLMADYDPHRGTNKYDWMENELFADFHVKMMSYPALLDTDDAFNYVHTRGR